MVIIKQPVKTMSTMLCATNLKLGHLSTWSFQATDEHSFVPSNLIIGNGSLNHQRNLKSYSPSRDKLKNPPVLPVHESTFADSMSSTSSQGQLHSKTIKEKKSRAF